MREILFKAKRDAMNDFNWYYGNLVYHYDSNGTRMARIQTDETKMLFVTCFPETVCQYTGFKNANGVNIFEGDIVVSNNTTRKVTFKCGKWGIEALDQETCAGSEINKHYSLYLENNQVEIIGSIHDKENNNGSQINE